MELRRKAGIPSCNFKDGSKITTPSARRAETSYDLTRKHLFQTVFHVGVFAGMKVPNAAHFTALSSLHYKTLASTFRSPFILYRMASTQAAVVRPFHIAIELSFTPVLVWLERFHFDKTSRTYRWKMGRCKGWRENSRHQ
jgi:hypothetical protein